MVAVQESIPLQEELDAKASNHPRDLNVNPVDINVGRIHVRRGNDFSISKKIDDPIIFSISIKKLKSFF